MRRFAPVCATIALTASLAATTALTAPAHAGAPGKWTTVTGASADIGNIARPSSYRTADGVLHVVYTLQETRSTQALEHVAIGDAGQVLSTSTVVSGWDSIDSDPELVPTSTGGLRVVFGGIRSTTEGETYTGAMASAASDDGGATWTLDPYFRSQSGYAYASSGTGAALAADGSTYVAFPVGSTIRYSNAEIAARNPDTDDPKFETTTADGVGACCQYDVSVAPTDSGQVWIGWYSNASGDNLGYFVRQIAPTLGPVQRAPKSLTDGDAGELGGGTSMVSTKNGIYFAYQVGYPQAGVGVWKIGASAPLMVPVSDALYASISADAEGRIWAVWYDDDSRQVFAARTNHAVTRFGRPVNLKAPKLGGESSVWSTLIDPRLTGNVADVVVNTREQLMHQQVGAGLSLSASPGSWKAKKTRKVTFTVTDAGESVAGAVVKADGKTCKTASNGRCTLKFAAQKKTTKFVVKATRADYSPATITVRAVR